MVNTHNKPADDILQYILESSDLSLISSIFYSLPFNVYAKNKKGQFIFVSPAMAEAMGKPVDEILGKTDYDHHPNELADKYLKDDKFIMESRTTKTIDESWDTQNLDEQIYVRVIKAPLIDKTTSNVLGTLGIFWDRTEEVLKEKELIESQEKYSALIEQASEGILLIDPLNRKILEANKAFRKITEYTESELLEIDQYDLLLSDRDKDFSAKILQKLINGEQVDAFPRTYITKGGKTVYAEVSAKIINYKDQTTILVIVRDITQRKIAEDEQKKLKAQLRRAQQLETIGVMAGGVAHDLNNILAGIVSYPELILQQLPKDSPFANPLETIQQSGQRAAAVVADLLTVARGAASPKTISNVNDLINEYFSSPEFQVTVKNHPNIEYIKKLNTSSTSILCSPIHIIKCIMNLVVNAAEAIENSGTISIVSEQTTLSEKNAEQLQVNPGEYAVLHISNDGPKIPEEDMSHIFEPFYTRKQQGKSGTGLGLTIVWTTMKELGGTVSLTSTKGETTFSVFMPVTKVTNPLAIQEESNTVRPLYSGTALVIDDEATLREIGSQILQHIGYTTYRANSGEKGLKFLENNKVDLVLLDMQMPHGIDGHETYQKIIELYPDQPAIIASGYTTNKKIQQTCDLGPAVFIKKPYTIEDIQGAIQKVIPT